MRFFSAIFRVWVTVIVLVGWPAAAEETLLIDLYQLPDNCTTNSSCLNDGAPIMTSILQMRRDQALQFTEAIESNSLLSGVSQGAADVMCRRNLRPNSLTLDAASDREILADHPGVYFDSAKVDTIEEVNGFSDQVREVLKRVGLKMLSKEEWDRTPGRPTLTLTYSPGRENAGCIIPFYVSLTLKEEVLLARDLSLKVSTPVWSKTVRQNLTSRYFSPQSAISDLLDTFESAFLKANPS